MQAKTKKTIVWCGVGSILAIAVVLGVVYRDEINNALSSSRTAKPKDRDRGPIITTKMPPTSKKKAAVKKPAKVKKAVVKKAAPTTSTKPADTKKSATPPANTPPTDKTASPAPLVEPTEPENRCAELPFSYEFAANDPNAKDPFFKRYWGQNYGCFLAASHDLGMPGTIPQVRVRLEKMSERHFKRYKVKLEKIIRRAVCRTLDYYLSTCRVVLNPNHINYLSTEDIRVLLQGSARLHDVTPPDRFRSRRANPKRVRVNPSPGLISSTPPTDTDSPTATTKPNKRRINVGLKKRQRMTPRLCGSDLRACPKP
ncbi:MAG: hypothetical protein ABID64_04335 [Nitrospirota bacterium]